MNRIFLNKKEITNFDNDKDTIEFAEKLLAGKDNEFRYKSDEDNLQFELEGQGIINVDLSDINEQCKLTIFE